MRIFLRTGKIQDLGVATVLLFLSGTVCASTSPSPAIMSLSALNQAKADYQKRGLVTPSLKWLQKAANAYLSKNPLTVVDKKVPPSSFDKHDFMSLNPNIWPDPAHSGCYLYRDGAWNADNDTNARYPDRGKFNTLKKWVSSLSLGYFLFGRTEYAQKAVDLVRVWFLDPKTRMNPNLDHAYAWPCHEGQETGWASGIVELQSLYMILDSLEILRTSTVWTSSDQKQMEV